MACCSILNSKQIGCPLPSTSKKIHNYPIFRRYSYGNSTNLDQVHPKGDPARAGMATQIPQPDDLFDTTYPDA
jgi:hypothetical protein